MFFNWLVCFYKRDGQDSFLFYAGAVPACSGDGEAYVLRCKLRTQPDIEAETVLKNIHKAMGQHRSYLVLIERCLQTGNLLPQSRA